MSRRARGRETERMVSKWYQGNGWPFAAVTRGSGVDIENMPGLAPEVKARYAFDPVAWIKQATTKKRRDKGLPFVVMRPNGFGEANIGKWLVIMTLEDHTRLLHDAGYGDDINPKEDQGELRPTKAVE